MLFSDVGAHQVGDGRLIEQMSKEARPSHSALLDRSNQKVGTRPCNDDATTQGKQRTSGRERPRLEDNRRVLCDKDSYNQIYPLKYGKARKEGTGKDWCSGVRKLGINTCQTQLNSNRNAHFVFIHLRSTTWLMY